MIHKVIEKLFPGLIIRKPIFYSWDIGIRFELNSNYKGLAYGKSYFENVLNKSKSLFEEVFDINDDILVIYQEYIGINYRKFNEKNFCFQNIDLLKNIEYNTIKGLYDISDEDDCWKQAIFKGKISDINYLEILTAISNKDFYYKKPKIRGDTFFINISKEFLFHMYDDRGLDIISKDKKLLLSLYKKYNSWILDYDREQIDSVFKQNFSE